MQPINNKTRAAQVKDIRQMLGRLENNNAYPVYDTNFRERADLGVITLYSKHEGIINKDAKISELQGLGHDHRINMIQRKVYYKNNETTLAVTYLVGLSPKPEVEYKQEWEMVL